MEHLPAPKDVKRIDIPCICDDFDVEEFLDYPKRKNWTHAELYEDPEFGSRSPRAAQEFFQAWLFFGCLTGVFEAAGIELRVADFIRQGNENKEYIITESLVARIQEWRQKEALSDSRERKSGLYWDMEASRRSGSAKYARYAKITAILRTAHHFVNERFEAFQRYVAKFEESSVSKDCPPWPLLSLSITALGWALQSATFVIYHLPPQARQIWGSNQFLKLRLYEAGWCKGEVSKLMSHLALDGLYYVGSILSPRRDHDHKDCNEAMCKGRGIIKSYETRHATGCMGCEFIQAPEETVRIIKRGNVPLVSWTGSELNVVEYDRKSDKTYVAISHVWSDGMGNETENALPKCQLSRLQILVDNLYAQPRPTQARHDYMYGPSKVIERTDPLRKPAGFWMDTLCVPVQKEYTELRKDVIGQMRSIYEDADRVLVLDSWIQEIPMSVGITEKGARLYLSNWQHRLWTLQEGLMAQNLFFQFQDAPQSLESLEEEQGKDRNECPGFYCHTVGLTLPLVPLFGLRFPPGMAENMRPSKLDKFLPMLGGVVNRNTTRKSDETVCYATILNLNPKRLLDIPKKEEGKDKTELTEEEKQKIEREKSEKRMEEFIRMIGAFTPELIFNDLPRLQRDGYRWAPRTYLSQANALVHGVSGRSKRGSGEPEYSAFMEDGGGLKVTYPGIQLESAGQHLGEKFYLTIHDNSSYFYRVVLQPDESGNYPEWDVELKYAILSWSPIVENGEATEAILGVLISTHDHKHSRLKLRHICRARVESPNQQSLAQLKEQWKSLLKEKDTKIIGEDVGHGDFLVFCRRLKNNQKWRVM